MDGAKVYVQVVPVEAGREIGWGSSLVQQLDERRESIKEAIVAGSSTVAESLAQLRPPSGDASTASWYSLSSILDLYSGYIAGVPMERLEDGALTRTLVDVIDRFVSN